MARCRCWCFGVAVDILIALLGARSCRGSLVLLLESRFRYRWLGPVAGCPVLPPIARSRCLCLGRPAGRSVPLLVSQARCRWLGPAAGSPECCMWLGPAAGASISPQVARCAADYSVPPPMVRSCLRQRSPVACGSVPLSMALFRCWWLSPDAGGSVPLLIGRSPGSSYPMLFTDPAVVHSVPLQVARPRC